MTDIENRKRGYTWGDPSVTAAGMAGRTGLEFLRAIASGELPAAPIAETLGFTLGAVDEGRVTFVLDAKEFHYNPIGSVHGGVYATLLDSAAACSVQSMLPAGVGYTSLDLNVKFLRRWTADTGPASCTGQVVHLGSRTALARAELKDANGKLLAEATSSCLILRG
jgi:uncharacterized protein (TIGR00369 family)